MVQRRGRNEALCEGMIGLTREVWLIRNGDTGELRIVDEKDWRRRVKGAPVTTAPTAAQDEQSPWRYVKTIDDANELVSLTSKEAVEFGLSERVFDSMAKLGEHYNIAGEPAVLVDNWSETLVDFLTSTQVAGLLFFAGILCIYIEINTPGFGVAGGIAIACFAILFGSRFLVGMANWWEIAIFVIGLILISIEVFVTPGFGVAGISGIMLCVVGLLAMLVRNPPGSLPIPQTDLAWKLLTSGLLALMIGFIGAMIGAVVLAHYLPEVPLANRLILAAPVATAGPAGEAAPIRSVQQGDAGKVEATCRPVGRVRIGELLIDAVTEGEFIAAGTDVKVTRNEGNRVVITPVAPEPPTPS